MSQVRIATFADGTALVRVAGCPHCGRWTRTTSDEPHVYPYHVHDCEFARQPMPCRWAHIDPADAPYPRGPRILALLDDAIDPESWTPSTTRSSSSRRVGPA